MSSVKANLSSTKRWSPAIIAKRADNIISSDYAKSTKVFTPSYERECRPCMDQLIANEYQRIWWQERDAWAKGKTPQTKPKKFGVKAEGSSYNVAMTKSVKNIVAPQTKASKENNVDKMREKNSQYTTKKRVK